MGASWYVERQGKETGPYTGQQLKELVASGKLRRTDLVRRQDQGKAVPAERVNGLFPSGDGKAQAVPPPAPAGSSARPKPPPVPVRQRPAGAGAGAAGPVPGQAHSARPSLLQRFSGLSGRAKVLTIIGLLVAGSFIFSCVAGVVMHMAGVRPKGLGPANAQTPAPTDAAAVASTTSGGNRPAAKQAVVVGEPFVMAKVPSANWIKNMVFSPDGHFLIADGKYLDVKKGAVRSLDDAALFHPAFPGSGQAFAALYKRYNKDPEYLIREYDPDQLTGSPKERLGNITNPVWSTDGKALLLQREFVEYAKINDNAYTVYDLVGNSKRDLRLPSPPQQLMDGIGGLVGPKGINTEVTAFHAAAFSADNKLVAIGQRKAGVHVFDAVAGSLLKTLPYTQTGSWPKVAFSQDGRTLLTSGVLQAPKSMGRGVGSVDSRIVLWDTSDFSARAKIDSEVAMEFVGFLPDGNSFVVRQDRRPLSVWDTMEGKKLRDIGTVNPGDEDVFLAAKGSWIVTGGNVKGNSFYPNSPEQRVCVWDVATGDLLASLTDRFITSVAVSPDGSVLATAHLPVAKGESVSRLKLWRVPLAGQGG